MCYDVHEYVWDWLNIRWDIFRGHSGYGFGQWETTLQCKMIPGHDDVIKWKHFPRYWPFVRRIHPSPVNSPHKGQWRGALMFSLICTRISGWINNREAGDYDVTVMCHHKISWNFEAQRFVGRVSIYSLKLSKCMSSFRAEPPVKFQSDVNILTSSLTASRL